METKVSGESFVTPPGAFSELISEAIEGETGLLPDHSTAGGSSDARFIKRHCPVVEFGPRRQDHGMRSTSASRSRRSRGSRQSIAESSTGILHDSPGRTARHAGRAGHPRPRLHRGTGR